MSDTPSQGDPISLDSVIDELLESAAHDQTATTAQPEEPDVVSAPQDQTPDPHGPDLAAATHHSELIQDPLNESLAKSLDVLLKEAEALQATVSEVAPELPTDLAPPPAPPPEPSSQIPQVGPASETAPAAPLPSAEPLAEAEEVVTPAAPGGEPPEAPAIAERAESDAGTIQSLDAELAALTDDLLAGDFEAPARPESEQAPETPHAQEAESSHPAAHAASVVAASAAVAAAAREPASQSPAHPSASDQPVTPAGIALLSRVIALLKRGAIGASEPARIALGLVSAPLAGKRSLQQSIGWLGAYTLFVAAGLWIYLIAFHTPQGPQATSAPSSLQGGSHTDDHDSDHDKKDDGTHKPSGTSDHGTKSDAHASPKADSGHGAKDAHGAKDSHGAKKGDSHGAPTQTTRVVNGYAVSKHAPAGAAKKDAGGAKDSHGAKKDDKKKSGGH
ncbi:MAG: hypothetical protein KIT19_11610 [Phycisphaeraceae bacterium]|nr:hypothetical protein [Phycisphaeraceae bacterium]